MYDNWKLSDFGFIICNFDSGKTETVSNGSNITFNTVSTLNNSKQELVSTKYSDYLTATFQICKNTCKSSKEDISINELRQIMKWLNRKEYHKFKLLDEEYINFYFEASFNVKRIELNGKIYGLELTMFTNRPYAIHEPLTIFVNNIEKNGIHKIYSKSDEEGFIHPNIEITINADGDFELYSYLEDRTMRIANCKKGEVIKINHPIIESSLSLHKVQNDFNWIFFRIVNTFRIKENKIRISLPSTIKIEYSPVVQVGL